MLKSSKNRVAAVAALQFLDSVKIDGDSSFRSRSVNIFNFIFKVEAVVRGILNVTLIRKYHDEDLREVLL